MERPFIIGIGGTCSNSGKTTLAVLLLNFLTQSGKGGGDPDISSSMDESVRRDCFGKWGAIKYTKTELYSSFVVDREALSSKEKDSGRFFHAGAEEVIWLKSPPQALREALPLAVDRLSYLDGIVVEGNSATEFSKPDIAIFIFGNSKKNWKTGIEKLAGISDIIVCENEAELPEAAKMKRIFFGDRSGIKEVQVFLDVMSDLISKRKAAKRDNAKGC
jgi:molybdopterin-guanine dinucleotide biosynthesis protein